MTTPDVPLVSRASHPERIELEVRPMVGVDVASVLDAECAWFTQQTGKPKSRNERAAEILTEHARREARRASLIARVAGSNPALLDGDKL